MLKQDLSSLSPVGTNAGLVPLGTDETADDGNAFVQNANEQVAREVAEIEAATAALRRAEPALESWNKSEEIPAHKPRPVWLIIGVLWLSTALVAAGAVVAIATLAG